MESVKKDFSRFVDEMLGAICATMNEKKIRYAEIPSVGLDDVKEVLAPNMSKATAATSMAYSMAHLVWAWVRKIFDGKIPEPVYDSIKNAADCNFANLATDSAHPMTQEEREDVFRPSEPAVSAQANVATSTYFENDVGQAD